MRPTSTRADASALVSPGAAPFEADAPGYDAAYDSSYGDSSPADTAW